MQSARDAAAHPAALRRAACPDPKVVCGCAQSVLSFGKYMQGDPKAHSGQDAIAAFFEGFEYKTAKVIVATLDSQSLCAPSSTAKDGVLVAVAG